MPTIVWLQALSCGGETISVLNSEHPSFSVVLEQHSAQLRLHPSLIPLSESESRARREQCEQGETPLDVLIVEGALESPEARRSDAGLTEDCVVKLSRRARYVMAVGTCASFGGIMLCRRKGAAVLGLQFRRENLGGLLGAEYRSQAGLPVINVPGCPAHPDWITGTLAALLENRLSPECLDRFNRPLVFYSKLAHHACPRNEYYEFKASAVTYSQQGCLFENLGCKGTQCQSDCNERLWMGRTGSCPRGGFPCLSCTSPKFPDGFTPFFQTAKIGNIPTTLPLDVPKAWYVGISGLSKLACPKRLSVNAVSHKWVETEEGAKRDQDAHP